ncbi:hypothetical protein VN0142_12150 [Helicobacter pylori]
MRSSQEGAYNKETKKLDLGKLYDNIKETTQMPMMNILLMGATGVGKSSLINGLFGQEIAKAGVGKSLTQHLLKSMLMEKRA